MLTPEYLWSVADPVVNIWEELNDWAIKDICERLMAAELYDYRNLPGTARYRAWLLNQSGMHYEEMIRIIAKLTKKSEKEVKHLFEEAGLLSLENDRPIYENRGVPLTDIRNNSGLLQILNEAYQRTNGELKNYTRTTLTNSRKQIYDSLDKAYMAVVTGTRSYSEVIRETVEDLSKDSTTVTYPSGHKDKIDVAVRRAVLTGINQGAAMISLENALQNGYEYLIIDAHIGARVNDNDKIANHAGWQGKIFKIIGSTEEYGNITEETGFPGNPLGLCGYNCRHHFFPHILGDPNPFERNIPDEEENRKAYELSQKQRYMERRIRETKRNLLGLETCIKNCPDEKNKFDLQMEYDKKAAKLQKQNKAYREFCKENRLQTEDDRLKSVQWDRSHADSARGAAKRYNNAKNVRLQESTQGDTIKIRSIAGVKCGKAMTFEEADSGHVNPNYGTDPYYAINCQACVPTFEARQRGYNVQVLPNRKGSMCEKLSRNTNLVWIDPKTGEHPHYIFDHDAKSPKKYLSFIQKIVKQGERYSIEFGWSGRSRSGHIVNLDRTEEGLLRIKDNQRGQNEVSEWIGDAEVLKYLARMKYKSSNIDEFIKNCERLGVEYSLEKITPVPKLLRIDNMEFDFSVADEIMEGAKEI